MLGMNGSLQAIEDETCYVWDDYLYVYEEVPCDDEFYQPAWVSELEDTVMSWGFDPELAAAWLDDREKTWEQIEAEQQATDIAQMEKDIKEIADKAEVFFTSMMDDLRYKQEVEQEIREEDLTALLDEGLQKIE